MPFWTKSDFLSAVCLESLTVSIAFLEYPRISPCRERVPENCPTKMLLYLLRLFCFPHFVRIHGRKVFQALVQEKTASPRQLVFLSYLNN